MKKLIDADVAVLSICPACSMRLYSTTAWSIANLEDAVGKADPANITLQKAMFQRNYEPLIRFFLQILNEKNK